MAILDYRDNITGWLRPETLCEVADGARPIFWEDSSGNDRDFSTFGGCVVKHNVLNGWPVIDLNGTNGYLESPADADQFFSSGAGTVFSVFKARSVEEVEESNLGDPVWCVNFSSAGVFLRDDPAVLSWNDGSGDSVVLPISLDTWYVQMWRHSGGRLANGVDRAINAPDTGSGATATLTERIRLGFNLTFFSDIQLFEWIAVNDNLSDQDAAVFVNYLMARVKERGDAHAQAQRVASGRLYSFLFAQPRLVIPNLPPAAIDLDVLDDFLLQHKDAPSADGLGAGPLDWQALPARVEEVEVDLDAVRPKITAISLRGRRPTFYATGRATSIPQQGVALIAAQPGNVLSKRNLKNSTSTALDGKAWSVRATDNLVQSIGDGTLKIEPDGVLTEVDADQANSAPAFVDADAGWTLTQPTGGSVVAELTADAGIAVFDPEETEYCLRFDRGTSGDGVADITNAITESLGINRWAIVQIDAAGVAAGFSWDYYDVDNALWFDNASGTFVGSQPFNPITPGALTPAQTVSKPIEAPTGGSDYQLILTQKSGVGSVGDVARVFYAGIVQSGFPLVPKPPPILRWPCSRIVTANTGPTNVTMGRDRGPVYPNHAGARAWNNARGSAHIMTKIRWNSDDVLNVDGNTLKFVVVHVYYDTDNEWMVYFYKDSSGPTFELRFDCKAAGTTYRATLTPGALLRDIVRVVGVRWTSAAGGELGLSGRTLSVFLDDAKGTDAVAAAYPTETSLSFLGVGVPTKMETGSPAAEPSRYVMPLCGWRDVIEVLDECPSDDEMKVWRL